LQNKFIYFILVDFIINQAFINYLNIQMAMKMQNKSFIQVYF